MVHKRVIQMAAIWAGSMIAEARATRKMKKAKAVDEKNAKKPKELGIHESYLKKLVKLGIVKRTQDGRYYLPK